MSVEKVKFPRAVAVQVARELCEALAPVCERMIVAGSLRRRKAEVGDVEILYIPRFGPAADGELFARPRNLADIAIAELERGCVLSRRVNVKGSEMFGEKNKLMRHTLSRMPVDLFATTAEAWWNYLVCRTGGAESNTRIATLAKARGWKWNPYGAGFSRGGPLAGEAEESRVEREEDVFAFVGLPYEQPWERP